MDHGRFVAVGDSFTEGVGDPHLHHPNGYRGWADRMARQLGRADPRWEYANLAIRSKRIDQVLDEQLDAALALRPTLASFFAGGNDLLALRADVDAVLDRYDSAVAALGGVAPEVVVFTAFDPATSALLEPLARRVRTFNTGVREIARRRGAVLVDHAGMREFDDRRLWAPDRIHLSRWGHKRMAAAVLQRIGREHTLRLRSLAAPAPRTPVHRAVREEVVFVRTEVVPLVRRRLTGRNQGDTAVPKWPEPVRPADGLKRLARTRGASGAGATMAG